MHKSKKFILILMAVLMLGYGGRNVSAQNEGMINITSVPKPLALPNGPGDVTYSYAVSNFVRGVSLADVKVVDDKCRSVEYLQGDENGDSKLDYSETWKYRCTIEVLETTQSIATVTGTVDNRPIAQMAHAKVVVGSDNVVGSVNLTDVATLSPDSIPSFPETGTDSNLIMTTLAILAGILVALGIFFSVKRSKK